MYVQIYQGLSKTSPKNLRKNLFNLQIYYNCFAASLLPTHNKGKKHQKLLNLKQERENSSKKSIYVRGFQNSGSIEEDLAKYFDVYGKVSNIFLDKDKVHLSNIQMITLSFRIIVGHLITTMERCLAQALRTTL